jgi:hypothetical protein
MTEHNERKVVIVYRSEGARTVNVKAALARPGHGRIPLQRTAGSQQGRREGEQFGIGAWTFWVGLYSMRERLYVRQHT